MGQYSLAEAKPIAAPSSTVAKGAYRLEEAKPLEQDGGMISSFVKGLKNFTPPLGAGSTTTKEASKAEVLAIREKLLNDPLNYIADQVPFVSQIKKIASDLKSGKDKGDVAAEAVGELIAGAASSPPILMGGATPTTARARYGGGLAETPKPSKPVNVGGLMDMAKTGKDILQVLKSPNPLTKLSALGRLFEKFASEVTPIEAPPAPTVVEAPPVASGTPVRPPLRGKQFGTFNDPTAPPLPAGVTPAGPVLPPLVEAAPPVAPGVPLRPPLRGRQFGTTVAQMMREEVPGRQFGTSSQSRLVPAEVPAATVPAEVPPAAVETPQPATPAPSAAGKPVTAATLMEEAANPAAQVNNPNYDWRAPEGITAEFKQYLKDSGFDVVPDRPEFDPTNPKAQGKFGGSAKTQVNMDAKANRFVEYLKANKLEPTPDNVARATQTLNEADHPSAHTLEKIYTQMGYDALDVEELLARSMAKAESPAASAAAKPPVAPEVLKAAAKPRLDHGELNLPLDKRGGGSINSQLDRYKADLAKAEKAAAKEAAGIRKSDKAIARDLFTQHAQALAESTAAKRGIPVSDSIKLMDSMAKWEPKKLIKLLEKYQADNPKSTTVGELMEKAKVKK